MLALALQEAKAEAEADVPETTEGKTHEGSRGGTGEGRRTPRPTKGGGFGWWGRPQPAVQLSESFGQASVESSSQGHLLKCTRDPPAAVPLPCSLTGRKQQGRHGSCEQCRDGSRGTVLGPCTARSRRSEQHSSRPPLLESEARGLGSSPDSHILELGGLQILEPQCTLLCNRGHNSNYLIRLSWQLNDSIKKQHQGGTSLVAQWIGIGLPMQGTRVRSLAWEDSTSH